jgi:hypothetical protein
MTRFPCVNACFGRTRQTIRYKTYEDQDISKDQDTKIYQENDMHNIHDKIKSKTRFALKVVKCTIRVFLVKYVGICVSSK